MKISFSGLFIPANETVSCANIPWRRAPCQTGNGAATGKGHIFEMLSNGLCVTKIVVLTYKAIKDLLKGSSANLLKADRKQVGNTTMNGRVIDCDSGWLLSLCKRVGRDEFSGRQFNEAFRLQEKKQASANHIFKNTIRLPPAPFPANLLRNEAPAFIRMCFNNPPDGCNIFPGDGPSPICYDRFHSRDYKASGIGTQIISAQKSR